MRPVMIERHGEPRLVMLSLREYQRLAMPDHHVYHAWEMPDDHLEIFSNSITAAETKPAA